MSKDNVGHTLSKPAESPRRRSPRRISPPSTPDVCLTTIRSGAKRTSNDSSGDIPSLKKKRKASRPYADPSVYAHLPQDLSDVLAHNLTLLLVGLNPGVMTAQTGFHFANPTNLFWPLLYSSGIIGRPMKACESASIIPEFNVGITNIVRRPTAEGGELSKEECVAGAASLEELVRICRPKAIALTGKGIWDAMFRHIHGRSIKKSDEFKFGWQEETIAHDQKTGYRCNIFVTMGTSGRVAAYSPAYKREVFAELGQWVQMEREREKALCSDGVLPSKGQTKIKEEAAENNIDAIAVESFMKREATDHSDERPVEV